jgi:hypothetical protein
MIPESRACLTPILSDTLIGHDDTLPGPEAAGSSLVEAVPVGDGGRFAATGGSHRGEEVADVSLLGGNERLADLRVLGLLLSVACRDAARGMAGWAYSASAAPEADCRPTASSSSRQPDGCRPAASATARARARAGGLAGRPSPGSASGPPRDSPHESALEAPLLLARRHVGRCCCA